jgi:molybdenum cofactor cytidylyltransferase
MEADGSRRLPLKAPGGHEPEIPDFVDRVIVLAGLSGVGERLGPETVHRPAEFSALSGLEPGEPITPEGLARVLSHPSGGLKNIPDTARRHVYLNQADDPDRIEIARQLARRLGGSFDSIIAGNLPVLASSSNLPDPPKRALVEFVHARIAGIILAAGGSQRFGGLSKQTLIWRGAPFARHVTQAALAAGLDPVVVVTGAHPEEVENAVGDLPVVIRRNPDWQSGQGGSVQVGIRTLPQECGGAVFLLADQPQVQPPLIEALTERHSRTLAAVVAPFVSGRRGNPVLFDRVTFVELAGLQGDTGGRALFSKHPVERLEWEDNGILLDVDNEQDYAAFLEKYPDSVS